MPKQIVRIVDPFPDEWVVAQEGKYIDSRHFNRLISSPTDVYKPDGSPLLLYRPRAIPAEICDWARPALRNAGASYSEHRRLSSAITGYYSNGPGECRLTVFTRDHLDGWATVLPFVRQANSVFARELPSRYAIQRDVASRTDPNFVIGQTAFTTMTVNLWDESHDGRTRVHRDAGDLPEGFGVISILRSGNYKGGLLVFPKYRVAVDLRTTDVLLCDVHEFHGNTAIVGEPGFERIACIMYYRSEIQTCSYGAMPGKAVNHAAHR